MNNAIALDTVREDRDRLKRLIVDLQRGHDEEVERLTAENKQIRAGNAKLREQNYCTQCGNILDGYEEKGGRDE